MPNLISLDQAFLLVAFFVPGYIISFMRSMFTTGLERQGTELFVRYLSFSSFNMALWVILGMVVPGVTRPEPWVWLLIIFVSPLMLGVAFGILVRGAWITRILSRFGLHTAHPTATAWDWKFGTGNPYWLQVSMKDGTSWAGYWGQQSFASSDAGQRDLYLELVYTVDDETYEWHNKKSSVWLSGSEIVSVEFYPLNEKGSEHER